MPELEVSIREVVQTRWGETIGLIVGVWDDRGFYQGSYFEQVKVIPESQVRNCRNHGINSEYVSQHPAW